MASGARGAKRPGFTLIEMLAALTLMAVIAGGMTLAFGTSLRAATTIRDRAERSDERRALVTRLKADLQGVWVRPGSETTWFRGVDAGGLGSSTGSQGDALVLTTARPISPEILASDTAETTPSRPQSDVAEVSWQLETDAGGSLALVRRERTPPDPEIEIVLDTAVVPTVLARGITDFNVRYFDGVEWLDTWDTTTPETAGEETTDATPVGLPRAVEVTLFLADPRGRGNAGAMVRAGDADEPRLTLVVALPGAEDAAGQGIEIAGEVAP